MAQRRSKRAASSPGSGKRQRAARPKAPPPDSVGRVRTAIRKVRPDLPARAVTPRASLVRDLGIDSLKLAELSIALEEAFERPVFLGDILADIEDPAALTVQELADHLASEP